MWGARLTRDGAAAWSWGSTGSNYWGGEHALGVSSRVRAGETGGGVVGDSLGVDGAEGKQRAYLSEDLLRECLEPDSGASYC